MTDRNMTPTLPHLCHEVSAASAGTIPDAELLDRFISTRDEAAFELLVYRHGPLVLGVCRRLLDRPADVEDVFQATFLVLVRRGHQIGKRSSVGSWLYKVAFRLALRVRAKTKKLASRERPLALLGHEPVFEAKDDLIWRDLRPILDAEVQRLPEAFRVPFILC